MGKQQDHVAEALERMGATWPESHSQDLATIRAHIEGLEARVRELEADVNILAAARMKDYTSAVQATQLLMEARPMVATCPDLTQPGGDEFGARIDAFLLSSVPSQVDSETIYLGLLMRHAAATWRGDEEAEERWAELADKYRQVRDPQDYMDGARRLAQCVAKWDKVAGELREEARERTPIQYADIRKDIRIGYRDRSKD